MKDNVEGNVFYEVLIFSDIIESIIWKCFEEYIWKNEISQKSNKYLKLLVLSFTDAVSGTERKSIFNSYMKYMTFTLS